MSIYPNRKSNKDEAHNQAITSTGTRTISTFIFFEEGKEDSPYFIVEAYNETDAWQLAYESFGPQVEDLFMKLKSVSGSKP